MKLDRTDTAGNPPVLCVDCGRDLLQGASVLSVATPVAFACMCDTCLAKYVTRDAALARLRNLLPSTRQPRFG